MIEDYFVVFWVCHFVFVEHDCYFDFVACFEEVHDVVFFGVVIVLRDFWLELDLLDVDLLLVFVG